MNNITARRFDGLLNKALKKGEEGLDEAVDLYLWARDNLKAMHRVDPNYTQGQTITAIQRVFNVDPEVYIRTACRLGGGPKQSHATAGRRLIKKLGTYETFRADKLLDKDDMRRVALSMGKSDGPTEFRIAVDKAYNVALAKAKGGGQGASAGKSQINYRTEYLKLVKKVAELEARLDEKDGLVAELRKENRWLKSRMPKVGSK